MRWRWKSTISTCQGTQDVVGHGVSEAEVPLQDQADARKRACGDAPRHDSLWNEFPCPLLLPSPFPSPCTTTIAKQKQTNQHALMWYQNRKSSRPSMLPSPLAFDLASGISTASPATEGSAVATSRNHVPTCSPRPCPWTTTSVRTAAAPQEHPSGVAIRSLHWSLCSSPEPSSFALFIGSSTLSAAVLSPESCSATDPRRVCISVPAYARRVPAESP